MKPWIVRTSLALNLLILALCVGVWLGRDQIIQSVLGRLAAARISFFESFPAAPRRRMVRDVSRIAHQKSRDKR